MAATRGGIGDKPTTTTTPQSKLTTNTTSSINTYKKTRKNKNGNNNNNNNDGDDDDDNSDLQLVKDPIQLLTDEQFDLTTRLFRFIRHLGFFSMAEFIDTIGAPATWVIIFLSIFIIPYILITTFLKLFFPIYLIYYSNRYADIPLDTYLIIRFVYDTAWYIAALYPVVNAFQHWRMLLIIDFATVIITTPLIISSYVQQSLTPRPLISLATTLTIGHLLFYGLIIISILYRLAFVTKDPFHPGFFPTRDANGDVITAAPNTNNGGQGYSWVKHLWNIIMGNVAVQNGKHYGRITSNDGSGGLYSSKQRFNNKNDNDFEITSDFDDVPLSNNNNINNNMMSNDSDLDDDINKPEVFGFGGDDDSDLSDLDAEMGF